MMMPGRSRAVVAQREARRLESRHDLATGAPLNRAARDGEIRRRLAASESVRAVARTLRCGLATVQRSRLAGGMRGAPRPVSGSGP